MDSGRQNTTGFVFGSFMIAVVVAALLPTRERQLYDYDCHESGGLVTQLVGFPTLERERDRRTGVANPDPYDLRECWPERGLIAGRVLSAEEEFANAPTYRMVRTMARTGDTVETLRRRPALGAARSLPPRSVPTTGEEAVALLPDGPATQTGGTSPLPQLAALSTPPARAFPGGLATPSFGPGLGGGGFVPANNQPPPTGEGPGDPTGETPTPTPTSTPSPAPSPSPTTPAPTPEPTTPVPTPTTPVPTPTTPVPTPTTPVPTPTPTPPVVPVVPPPIVPPVAAVPEPASWLMMILGFFTIGAALRRRASGLRRPQLLRR